MTPEEEKKLAEFLAPSRIVMVATIGRTGMPQLTPNWYVFSDGKLHISTTKERMKYRNLGRDNRLAVCIYSEPSAADYVTITGEVEISDDDSIWPTTEAIVKRYVPVEGVQARLSHLRTENRVIISLTPDRIVFRT